MRQHIHFGHGRYVHRGHVQHALHFNRPIHTMHGGATAAIKKDIGSFRPAGEGVRRTHHGNAKKLKPLKFKF